MNLLCNPLTQNHHIALNTLHKHPNILLHLARTKPQLRNRHPHNPLLLAILITPHHLPNRLLHIPHHRPRLRARHQSLRPQHPPQPGLVQFLRAVAVAQESVEGDVPALDAREQVVFAHEGGAGFEGGGGGGGVGGADDGDAEIGFYRVWESDSVPDCGAVADGAHFYGEVVFYGFRGAADFEGADVAGERELGGFFCGGRGFYVCTAWRLEGRIALPMRRRAPATQPMHFSSF